MTAAFKTKTLGYVSGLPEEAKAECAGGRFERLARAVAVAMGRPAAFMAAVVIVLVWAIAGPLFHFSDTWQLAINTGTTIVTFLMVFLIQQSQNRDTLALQVKLAELIIAVKGAHNAVATAETLSEQELQELHADYRKKADDTLAVHESQPAMSVREALKVDAETLNRRPS
jgi:low affinity Fe/Cu permease